MADLTTAAAQSDSVHLILATSQTFSASQRDHAIGRINRSLVHIGESIKGVKDDLNSCLRRQSRDLLAADQEYSLASKQDNKYEFEILVNSSVKTFKQALRNLIHSSAAVKYLVLSTLDVNANGDLLFQDASFSLEDFLLALGDEKRDDLKLVVLFSGRSFADANKHWKSALDKSHKGVTTQLVAEDGPTGAEYDSFLNDLRSYLNEAPVDSFMDVSKFTGTLRINRPCLYIFPAKEGDSAYFTINGYSMLVNGGYDRLRPCFWRFVNMLQQIDSVLVTHTDVDALGGLGSFFAKKLASPDIKPNILSVLGNLVGSSQSKAAHTAASLIANEATRSDVDSILEAIEKLQIKLVPLVKTNEASQAAKHSKYEHINLYSKMGHGSLDLYILSPFASSKELKDFVQQQLASVDKHIAPNKSHLTHKSLLKTIPLSHLNSAVVLVVWLPSYSASATGNDNNALRLLFTGNAPQNVIFSALEKVKDFDVIQSATYKAKAVVTPQETAFHSLVTGVKKSLAAAASSKPVVHKEAAPSNGTASSSDNSSKPAHPKPVHTTTNPKPSTSSIKPAADASAAAAKPVAPPKPASKPVPAQPPKDAIKTGVKNGHDAGAKAAAAKPKESKEGDDHKGDAEVKKSAPKVAAKPAPAPPKPKEAPKSAEANGHAPPTKPAANCAPKSAEKPKPAAKPAPKPKEPSAPAPAPKPKEPSSAAPAAKPKEASAAPKKPAAAAKSEATKKEKDETSRIITKRNVPSKSTEPAKVEDVATPVALTEPVAVVEEAPQKQVAAPLTESPPASVPAQEEAVISQKDEAPCAVEPVVAITESSTVQEIEPEVSMVEETAVVESEHNESLAQEPENEHNESAVQEAENDPNESVVQDAEPSQPEQQEEAASASPVQECEQNESVAQETHQDESIVQETEPAESAAQEAEQNESLVESTHEAEKAEDVDLVSESQVKAEVESHDSANDFVVVDADPSDLLGAQLEGLKLDQDTHDKGDHHDLDKPEPVQHNGNGVHSDGFENGHGNSEVTQKQNGNGLIDFDSPNGDSYGKGKGVLENLINIEGEVAQNYEKTVDEAVAHNTNFGNDPTQWNLLELPKPVIPSDSIVSEANTSLAEKSTPTANGKKASLGPETKDKPAGNKTAAPKAQVPAPKPVKPSNIHPAYVEVTYIPAHGNSFYVDSEYFKRVRARFYILSTLEPSEALLNSIIEGKESWEDKNLQMSIIPTYESESLRRWFVANEETLARLKIDIMPAANLATLTMDDNPDLSFQLYKLEF